MAIIKTADTYELILAVSENIRMALNGGSHIAVDCKDAAAGLDAIPDGQSSATVEVAPGTSWVVQHSPSSASYRKVLDDAPDRGFMLLNGYQQVSLGGDNLDRELAGPALATSFTRVASVVGKSSGPAALGSSSASGKTVAAIEFDLADRSWIQVGSYTEQLRSQSYESGRGPDNSATRTSSYSASSQFKGVSEFQLSELGPSELLSADLNSYRTEVRLRVTNDGSWESLASDESQYRLFDLRSAGGLSYQMSPGGPVLGGDISSITYRGDYRLVSDEVGGLYSRQDYFRYVDTAAAGDELDLAFLEAWFAASLDPEAAWALHYHMMSGNDQIVVTGNQDSHIFAGAGNDRVIGNALDDDLNGEDGDDLLIGGAGDDALYGGSGRDVLKAGAGDDYLNGDEDDDLLDGGAGNDRLVGSVGDDTLLGGAGNDVLEGGTGADALDGGTGNDEMYGGENNDVLKGGAGQDLLFGDQGDDTLDGGAGNDLLVGGAGRDIMTGGTGVDGFLFETEDSGDAQLSRASLDQIKGFNVAQDRLLFGVGFDAGDIHVMTTAEFAQLGQANTYEALRAEAEKLDSRIVVGYDNGSTYVFVDMNGDNTLDLAVELVGIRGDAVATALLMQSYAS